MTSLAQRTKVSFESADGRCAAWFYPGTNGACVVMAAGFAVIKEAGTDALAAVLHAAGYSVLAFDYRRFGESSGTPRQLVRLTDQRTDFQNAIDFAATLPGVAPTRIAIWGFSVSGGHVFALAARNPQLLGAIAHAPLADGLHNTANALRHMTLRSVLGLIGTALADAAGGIAGREPLLIPLAGERGTVASLTTPDSRNYTRALNPGNRYPHWRQEVAARSALRLGVYRPGRFAARIQCPLLVIAYNDDGVAPPAPAVRAGNRARRGRVVHIPGGHYAAFLDSITESQHALLGFLDQQLADASRTFQPSARRDIAP